MARKSKRPELNPIVGKQPTLPGFAPRWVNIPDSLGTTKQHGVKFGLVTKASVSSDEDMSQTDDFNTYTPEQI